jgi:hypothetical protein
VASNVGVGVGVGFGVTDGADPNGWGVGLDWTNQSAALSLVSTPLPADPPGRRSMLDFAGGAGAAAPSTNELVAVPQPTASITSPSIRLRTTVPPSAPRPPEYVASAGDA